MNPSPKQLDAFAESLRARGMEPREHHDIESIYRAGRTIWRHLCDLDGTNLKGWRSQFPLANSWAEGNACVPPWSALNEGGCRGNRTFPETNPNPNPVSYLPTIRR